MDSGLHLIGIAKKAGRLEVGEEPVGAACRARQARLLVLAADAADNTLRRAQHFAEAGNAPLVKSPYAKSELGQAVGRSSCAMLALTDAGLAASLMKKLSQADPEQYGEAAQALDAKAAKVLKRQKEQRQHEKNLQKGGSKPWAATAKRAAQIRLGKTAERRDGAPAKQATPAEKPFADKKRHPNKTRKGYKPAKGGRQVT